MKYLSTSALFRQILTVLSLMLLFSFAYPNRPSHHAGKCTGSPYCTACSNCSQCKYCHAGGTCGVCARPKTSSTSGATSSYSAGTPSSHANPTSAKQQLYAGQCQATTKKGTRCKRAAGPNGYCWQHGG